MRVFTRQIYYGAREMIKFLKEHPHWLVLLGGIALLPVIRWLGILVIIAALVAALGHFEDL